MKILKTSQNNLTPNFKKRAGYVERLVYTVNHKKAYLKVEKDLLGENTLGGYLHDSYKVLLYALGLPTKWVRDFHRAVSPHHVRNNKVKEPLSAIIDWESARFTKKDKQMDACTFYKKAFPDGIPEVEILLKKFGLWKD